MQMYLETLSASEILLQINPEIHVSEIIMYVHLKFLGVSEVMPYIICLTTILWYKDFWSTKCFQVHLHYDKGNNKITEHRAIFQRER
jgi:hypothetical protein